MTRKSWVYKIVRDLLLFGDGNSVVHVQYHDGFISNLLPFPMSQVSYKMDNQTVIRLSTTIRDTDQMRLFTL